MLGGTARKKNVFATFLVITAVAAKSALIRIRSAVWPQIETASVGFGLMSTFPPTWVGVQFSHVVSTKPKMKTLVVVRLARVPVHQINSMACVEL